MSRVERIVLAMVSGQMPLGGMFLPERHGGFSKAVKEEIGGCEEDMLREMVKRAIFLDQLIAEHERTQVTAPSTPQCPECRSFNLEIVSGGERGETLETHCRNCDHVS